MFRKKLFFVISALILSLGLVWLVIPSLAQDDLQIVSLPIVRKSWEYQPKITICMGQEPETLYYYGAFWLAEESVLEAVYDGPVDSESFTYQPVILQKMPSLADGDATIDTVLVTAGDLVVGDSGNPVILGAGIVVRPAGCRSSDCAITYSGTGTVEMDQMAVTFQLLPGLRWSDGVAVKASDSVYSFNLAGDPATPSSKYVYERTESYLAPSATTIIWTGLPGYLDATYYLNLWTPLPEHLWETYSADELVTAEISAQRPVGYGPYVIDSWTPGVNILLHRNPFYYRAGEGLPRFRQLEFRFIGYDPSAAITALLSGECDILDQTTGMDSQKELLQDLDASGLLNLEHSISTNWEHADFGIQHISYDDGYDGGISDRVDFFSDVRVRQAVAYCIDRQAVVDSVYYGLAEVLNTYIPADHPLYNPAVPDYPYNPAAGMALLDAVGWIDHDVDPATPRVAEGVVGVPDGTLLQFRYETTQAAERMAATQIMAESALPCGIQMDLGYIPASEFFWDGPDGVLFGRKFDVGQFAWLTGALPPCDLFISSQTPGDPATTWIPIMDPGAGPQVFPHGWGAQNNIGYYNPDYDTACGNAIALLPGETGYITYHQQAQLILSEDLPLIPLYTRIKVSASAPTITGYDLDPTEDDMWNIEEFDR